VPLPPLLLLLLLLSLLLLSCDADPQVPSAPLAVSIDGSCSRQKHSLQAGWVVTAALAVPVSC
jgi:hypothetical protein